MLESVLDAEKKGALKDLNSTSLSISRFQSTLIAELIDTMEPLMLFTLDAQCDDGTASTLLPSSHGMHHELTKTEQDWTSMNMKMDELVKKKTEDQCNDVYYELACALDPRTASFVAHDEGNIKKLVQAAYVAKRVADLKKVPTQVQDSEKSNEDYDVQEPTQKKQRKCLWRIQVDANIKL